MRCFGIIALVAVIGFAFITCNNGGGGGGGGGKNIKVRFLKTAMPQHQGLNINVNARGIMPLASVNVSGNFVDYNAFYNTTLGGPSKKVRSITPDSFKLSVSYFMVMGDGGNLIPGSPFLMNEEADFANNPTFATSQDIFLGTYDYGDLLFHAPAPNDIDGWQSGKSRVTFTLPEGKNISSNKQLNGDTPGSTTSTISNGNRTISVSIGALLPTNIKNYLGNSSHWGFLSFVDSQYIAFAGNSRKLLSLTGNGTITRNDVLSGYPGNIVTITGENPNATAEVFVIPFSPVTATEGINTFAFEIYWDLTDLIEQYSGADGTADTADDIFVLKNGWWNALSFRAVVE
jgi:hypothetical protein